jgi:hypothetical protein
MYHITDCTKQKAKELNVNGLEYANERKKLYKIRHSKDRNIKNSNGYFADRLLW